jgi:hypothetical protein
VARRLHLPLTPVLPASLCPLPGPLYSVLMGYKESPLAEARQRFAGLVVSLLGRFLVEHAGCVAAALGGGVDLVLPVPSSSRPGRPPLDRVPGLPERVHQALAPARWCPELLVRSGGAIGHMRPNADAFAVPERARPLVSGARLLLVDDTYVSGSRAQSAAAALRRAGGRATFIVPLGRVLRPDRSRLHADFLRRAALPPGSQSLPGPPFRPCCRCVQTGAPTE